MADRKPFLSPLVFRVAVVSLCIYLGVLAVGRYLVYCDYRTRLPVFVALQRAVTFDDLVPPGDFEGGGNYSEIEPGLYVGGSVKEPPPGTKAVLNLCEIEDPYQAEAHRRMKIADGEPAPDLDWLKNAVAFVTEQRKEGKTVYIHCAAGISRAGMVSAAYLMADRGWSRDKAIAYIREQRPQLNPNPAFMARLLEWQKVVAPAE
jgi:hypothetical protein